VQNNSNTFTILEFSLDQPGKIFFGHDNVLPLNGALNGSARMEVLLALPFFTLMLFQLSESPAENAISMTKNTLTIDLIFLLANYFLKKFI